jgi:hypothetical protein
MKKLSSWLYRVSTGKRALFFLLFFVVFSALILPGQSAAAEEYSADVGSPDLSFFYSAEELYRMAEVYGEEGREAYIRARFTFDLLWPIVYTLFLSTAISWSFVRAVPTYSGLRSVNLVPILAMVFDYLENISTSLVMWRYPEKIVGVAAIAPIFTLVKWTLLTVAILSLILGVVYSIRRRFKR